MFDCIGQGLLERRLSLSGGDSGTKEKKTGSLTMNSGSIPGAYDGAVSKELSSVANDTNVQTIFATDKPMLQTCNN